MITTNFAYALGEPSETLELKNTTADFIVEEQLGFEPEGSGEHLFLLIKKSGENTDYLAKQLARFLNVKTMDVGFCGLKDRHGETTQWFSVYAPKLESEPDWQEFTHTCKLHINILKTTRHTKKLRRGAHQANLFHIVLRGHINDVDALERRLVSVKQDGVPNYFGNQRFGRENMNLQAVNDWVSTGRLSKNRHKRGLIISSARAYLFNCILSTRVAQQTWRRRIPGDIACENQTDMATAALWGRGHSKTEGEAADIEQNCLEPYRSWLDKLEHCGLAQERRSLVCLPNDIQWQLGNDYLALRFSLRPGQYATSVIREIAHTVEQERHSEYQLPKG